MTAADIEADLREGMRVAGVLIEEPLVMDGTLHRFHSPGDRGSTQNGYYVVHDDDNPHVHFGVNGRIEEQIYWVYEPATLSSEERATAVRDWVGACVSARFEEAVAQSHGKAKLVLSAIHKLEEACVTSSFDPCLELTPDEHEVVKGVLVEAARQVDVPPNRSGYWQAPFLFYGVWIYIFHSEDGHLYLRSKYTGPALS
jgi:phage/plasmid primase-like uncharacterized protein